MVRRRWSTAWVVAVAAAVGGAAVEHDLDLLAVGELAYRVVVEAGIVA
jgi:hypothetical protein